MQVKRILLIYLSSYLIGGGIGFTFLPDFTQNLFLSNEIYSEPAIRLVGVLMMMLGGLIGYLVYLKSYQAYNFSIIARTGISLFLIWAYFVYNNPMFMTILVIVLVGLIPAYLSLLKKK